MTQPVVVRFPPSPTGEVHIGNARTLLFNYFFARKNGGKIVFRFEDTDRERSRQELERPMLDALTRLGLDWDEGPYRQSERSEIYKKYIHQLIDEGKAYIAELNQAGTENVVRLKNEARDIKWNDLVKGEISINTHSFRGDDGNPDIVIARSVDEALYHFTVVVDDWLMGVTHVLRGDDHVTSTPRQIMILEALGAPVPLYAHFPNIVGDDKKKLSKRKGNTSLTKFFDEGYLPETMVNYLAFLGWNPGDEREFFTKTELVQEFSLEKVNKSPAQFDYKRLNHINKHYLDKLTEQEYFDYIYSSLSSENKALAEMDVAKFKVIVQKVVRDRISLSSELGQMIAAGELDVFYQDKFVPFAEMEKMCFKNKEKVQTLGEVKDIISQVVGKIEGIDEKNWTTDELKGVLFDWADTFGGKGFVLHPLRTSLSGKERSPDPFTIMEIIGKKETLRRLALVQVV